MVQISLSPTDFAAISARVRQQGILLTGNQGKITKSGVTAAYIYAAGTLSIEILEKPFFVSTEYCEEQLKSFLAKA